MRLFCFDTESELMAPGCQAPRLACLSWRRDEDFKASLAGRQTAVSLLWSYLVDERWLLIGHHTGHDLAVMIAHDERLLGPVFEAYQQDRIRDTLIREQLLAIREGTLGIRKFGLDALTQRYFNRALDKGENSWRYRYGDLLTTAIQDWPEAAKDYALGDASETLEIYKAQCRRAVPAQNDPLLGAGDDLVSPDENLQTRAAFAFHLMRCWGVRTDPDPVLALRTNLEIEHAKLLADLGDTDVFHMTGSKKNPKRSRNLKAIQARVLGGYAAQGLHAPKTEPSRKFANGQVQTSDEVLKESGDPILVRLAEAGYNEKLLTTFVPILEQGTQIPIQPRWKTLVDTARSACIAKGSFVEVVRDVSKDPKGIPIEKVRPGDSVYSFDENRKICIRRVLKIQRTGVKKVIRLCWLGQAKINTDELILTPDHHVRRFDGSWTRADELQPGDRVMALSRGLTKGDYARLYPSANACISREHRFVYRETTGKLPPHIHHKDGNKLNNLPENREGLTNSEHTRLHGQNVSPRVRNLRSRYAKLAWKAGKFKHKSGEENPCWLQLSRDEIETMLKDSGYSILKASKTSGIDFDTLKKHARLKGIDLDKVKKKNRELRRDQIVAATAHARAVRLARKAGNNHTITAVEMVSEPVEVYDLTVEDTHCFIANEICVHNCEGPNLQNQPRKGGVRECYIPRPGWLFGNADYDLAELKGLGQIQLSWFGSSALADALRAGRDVHLDLSAQILGISYEDANALHTALKKGEAAGWPEIWQKKAEDVKDARQIAKVANFGYPGGLGANSFVAYAKGYGVNISADRGQEIREHWFARWVEMRPYFRVIGELTSDLGPGEIVQFRSGRVRGRVSFTQAANGFFQSLIADGAKHALWKVTKECYADPTSPLYGSRPIAFIHDEIMIESPEDRAPEATERLSVVMNAALQTWVPDIPIKSSPRIMRRWFKDAEAIRGPDGRLVPWEPKKKTV